MNIINSSNYEQRLDELRKQRDAYKDQARELETLSRKYADAMDELEGNYKLLNLLKGSYIKKIYSNSTVDFFKVEDWKNDTRAANLTGVGFEVRYNEEKGECSFSIFRKMRVLWTDIEAGKLVEIDEDAFYAAYRDAIVHIDRIMYLKLPESPVKLDEWAEKLSEQWTKNLSEQLENKLSTYLLTQTNE